MVFLGISSCLCKHAGVLGGVRLVETLDFCRITNATHNIIGADVMSVSLARKPQTY